MTLNSVMAVILLYFTNSVALRPITSQWLKLYSDYLRKEKCSIKNLVLPIYDLWCYSQRVLRKSALKKDTSTEHKVNKKIKLTAEI